MTESTPGESADGTPQVVAAFDFDGTLTTGGSVWRFLVAMVGTRRVAFATARLLVKLVRAALFGDGAADEAKEALFTRTLAGLSAEETSRRAEIFGVSHYRRHARSDVRERLEWHRRQGHRLLIVSASPDLYVRAVGRELGVDEVLATALEVSSRGTLTGRYDGHNCRGRQKLLRVEQWMAKETGSREPGALESGAGSGGARARQGRRGRRPVLWAYGNSAGDAALLAAAEVGIDAGHLGRLGKLRRFKRLSSFHRDESSAPARTSSRA